MQTIRGGLTLSMCRPRLSQPSDAEGTKWTPSWRVHAVFPPPIRNEPRTTASGPRNPVLSVPRLLKNKKFCPFPDFFNLVSCPLALRTTLFVTRYTTHRTRSQHIPFHPESSSCFICYRVATKSTLEISYFLLPT